VLFEGVFTWSEDPDAAEVYEPGKGMLSKTVDWDSKEQVPVPDLLNNFTGTRVATGPPV